MKQYLAAFITMLFLCGHLTMQKEMSILEIFPDYSATKAKQAEMEIKLGNQYTMLRNLENQVKKTEDQGKKKYKRSRIPYKHR